MNSFIVFQQEKRRTRDRNRMFFLVDKLTTTLRFILQPTGRATNIKEEEITKENQLLAVI